MKLDSSNELLKAELLLNKLLIVGIGLVCLKLVVYHFQVIVNPFPNEFRESAILLTTDLMGKGGNPYALVNQPQYTNVYGIFYHLIVLPFTKLMGTTFLVHRAVSAIFIFASCAIFFSGMRWRKIPLIFALSATLILYGHLLYFTTPLARPDSLGFFLFLCSIFIPWYCQYSSLSLFISILFGILGFLTKPYFVLSIVYLNLYLFIFKSKQAGIKQGIISLVLLTTTIFIFNYKFETYFNNVIWINLYISGHDFMHAIKQLYAYCQINYGILFILVICTTWHWNNSKQKHYLWQPKDRTPLKFNLSNIKKPLVNKNIGFIEFCLIVSLIVFLGKLGQHWGSWLIYSHHLISPFLIFLSFDLLNKILKCYKFTLINLLLTLFVLLNLLSVSSTQFLPQLEYSFKDWHNLSTLLSRHQHVFNSPAIGSILIEQGKKVYDSGQSQYFALSTKRQGLWNMLISPKRSEIQKRYEQFMQEVTSSVKSKKYDLVVLTKGYSPFISEDFLKNYYQYQETLLAPMSVKRKQNWELDIWIPN